jgi:iodotyrosine deiodinase
LSQPEFIPYQKPHYYNNELLEKSAAHYSLMQGRRSVRDFESTPIAPEVIDNIIMAASTAPSGANKQTWTFCVITNADLKQKIQAAAEAEEYKSYNGRMPETWLQDLAHIGTTWQKPFLTEAPALIIVFKKSYDVVADENKNNYYVTESVGIACGFLLQAIHACGLIALTHTPSPMNFLSTILNRPQNEKPFLLIPIGYPKKDAMVPNIFRKNKDEVVVHYK